MPIAALDFAGVGLDETEGINRKPEEIGDKVRIEEITPKPKRRCANSRNGCGLPSPASATP